MLLNLDTHATNVSASIERVEAQIGDVIDNPVTYLKSIIAVAGSQGLDTFKSHVIAAPLAKSLMVKHFGDNKAEANAILEQLGVVGGLDGMNFTRSTIFQEDHPDEIHLAVYYKVKVVQLFKWADFEATICKETRARAWLGGDDVKHLEQKTVIASGSSSGEETGGNGEASSTEGDDEEGSEDDEDSDSHVGDTGLEKYLAGVESEIIQEINQRYDTTDWTEAVSGIVLPIVSIKPTATPEPTEAPQPTETPAPTEAPQPTATPTPTITPEPTAAPTSSITFSSWEEMKEAHPRQVWAYIRENKPSYSPDIQKWFKNGGTITIEENEKGDKIWTYTSSSGDSVPYINGYVRFPDQYLHPDIKSIDIGEFNDRGADRRAVI